MGVSYTGTYAGSSLVVAGIDTNGGADDVAFVEGEGGQGWIPSSSTQHDKKN